MTLSAVSNATLTKNAVTQQKAGADIQHNKDTSSGASSGDAAIDKKFNDNVTLSQAEKTVNLSKAIDTEAAEKLFPQTIEAILTNPGTAISSQAKVTPQAAQGFLAEA